jgi:ribonuclease J
VRACIHRGAREVGGSCVEIEHEGARILLDLGLPLTAGFDTEPLLLSIPGLTGGDASLLGIIVSHGHPDHWGLVPHAHEDVPVFVGEATQRLLREAAFFTRAGAELYAAGFLRDRQPISLGPFTITPFLADHSAFDAYSILVEADERRIFYTGDVRAHGRKRGLFERLVSNPPERVNVLVMEGTHVRPEATKLSLGEHDLERELARVFRATDGLVLACYSPQNIDRLVTMFKAAKQSRRKLVLDLYAATMTRATGNARIPQADWDDVLVYVPLSQRIQVKRSGEFERTAAVRRHRVLPDQLADQASSLVMTFRASMARDLEQAGCLDNAHCVWSLWPGYLGNPTGERMRQWLVDRQIPLTVLHSSGHASVEDLQRLAAAIDADRVMPIHSGAPHLYESLFPNVDIRADGEWWDV